MKKVLTTCGYCGCGCNFHVNVVNDEIAGVTPVYNHPVSRGRLCAKGWSGHGFARHIDRLKQPLIRLQDGTFAETTWEKALEYITESLKSIIKRHGTSAIGVLSSAKCTNEENYLLVKYARAVLRTGNIDQCGRLCHGPTEAGLAAAFGSSAMTNSIEEISDADVIFIIGSNTTEQHPLIGMRVREAVLKKGARLIVADPRHITLSEIAEIYADLKPGTNLAFINGMLNVILSEGLENLEFIKNKTEGFGDFKASIEKYTPRVVADITGVSEYKIREAARIYAKGKNSSIIYASGITQHISGTASVSALANLALITGHIGKKASGVNPLSGQNNIQGACDMGALPNMLPGYQLADNENTIKQFSGAWGEDFNREKGLTLTQMMDEAVKGKLRSMFIMGENPAVSEPDTDHARKALKNLEFLVVQDIFMTETAKYARVVLPGASFFEKDGTFTSIERRVQRVRKAIEPIGNSKPDWMILCELMGKFGYPMNYKRPEEIFNELRSLIPGYWGITYDRLERGGIQWPCFDAAHPGTEYLYRDYFSTGPGKFSVNEYVEPGEHTDNEYTLMLATGRIQHQFNTGTMSRKSWELDTEYPEGFIEINPVDAKKLGIRHNTRVKVLSRRGEIETIAVVTEKISTGMVFIPIHFWEVPVNKLAGRNLEASTFVPETKICAVKVEGI